MSLIYHCILCHKDYEDPNEHDEVCNALPPQTEHTAPEHTLIVEDEYVEVAADARD